MSHRMLRPVASAAAVVLLMAACTSSPTATPRPTQTSVQATAVATTQATVAVPTTGATTVAPTTNATVVATAEPQSVSTKDVTAAATSETAMTTSEAPVGTTVAMATMEATVAPATKVPATEAPTKAPATEAPTTVPATDVPTKAPATEVPTKAPATEVPTKAPATEAPTKVPATKVPTVAPTEALPMATMEVGTSVAMATTEATVVPATMAATAQMTMAATAEMTMAATAEMTMAPTMAATAEMTAMPTGPQTFTDSDPSDGGITFVYPAGFVMTGGDKQVILTAADGSVLNVYAPATYKQIVGKKTFKTESEALEFFVKRVGLVSAAEPTASATAEATKEAETLVKGEKARTEVTLERRNQAGTAYLIDVGGGEYAVIVWLTPVGVQPSPALLEGFTSVLDTLTYMAPPPPPTEEPTAAPAATMEATMAATAEMPMATMEATMAAPMATMEATAAAAMPASVVDIAMGSSDFSTLVNAVVAADLVTALSDKTASYTVFAPTNEAFAAALKDMGITAEDLLKDKTKLAEILKYHVIPSKLLSGDLKAGDVVTLQGESVTISMKDGKVMVNDATVVTADVESSNGVVHVIDKVLLPPSMTKK